MSDSLTDFRFELTDQDKAGRHLENEEFDPYDLTDGDFEDGSGSFDEDDDPEGDFGEDFEGEDVDDGDGVDL